MRIVMNNAKCGELLAKIAGTTYNPEVDVNFCNVDHDRYVMGGTILSGYTGWSMQIHSASMNKHWLNRDMLFATFDYPFNQLKVKRLFAQVPATNLHAISVNRKAGFEVVTVVPGVYRDDVACVVMKLERENCRFLNITPRTIGKRNIDVAFEGTVH